MSEENQPVEEVETVAPVAEVEAPKTEIKEEESQPVEDAAETNRSGYEQRKRIKAERENERLKEQIVTMQQQQAVPQPATPVQQPQHRDLNQTPTIDQYDDTDLYMSDKVKFEATKMLQEQAYQQEQQKVLGTFDEKLREYEKTNPDIREDVMYISTKVSPSVEQAILNSDMGPKVAQMLATDKNLLNRLNNLDAVSVGREVYKLEEQAKVKPAISSAPDPIDSPKTSVSSNSSSPSGLSFAEHTAMMNKKMYG